ncbi:MAG: HAMP domain-containing sensor histidine kinase [Sulfuricurvum sp.]|nr:HAMP domain-containing sensor histidine kinase [Sulfuricurvum sp.]
MEEIVNEQNNEIAFLSRKLLELNKQLMESEKAKTRFLSLVANELNNPMTVLLGLIPRLVSANETQRQTITELMEQEALHLDFHIQNLVAAAEIENGEIKMSYARINPEELIAEVLKNLKYWMKERGIEIQVENTITQKVVTDPQKLHLILKNLLANACSYGESNSRVNIAIEQHDDTLTIAVTNRGKGPNVEYKAQIFTRFVYEMGGVHGLGIGLSIVRGLCELLDGSIDYEIGEGTVTFTVTLPLSAESPDSDACGSNEFMFESFDGMIEL